MAAVEQHQIRLADLRIIAARRTGANRVQRKWQLEILRIIPRRFALHLVARVQMPDQRLQLVWKILHRVNRAVIAYVKQRQKLFFGSLPLHVHELRLRAAVRSIRRFILVALQLVGDAVIRGICPLGGAGSAFKILDLNTAHAAPQIGGEKCKRNFHLRCAGAEIQQHLPIGKLLCQRRHSLRNRRTDGVHI